MNDPAQLGEPGELGKNSGNVVSTDTELTPVGKDGKEAGWEHIGGSICCGNDLTRMAGTTDRPSPTPYDLDFFGVDFLDKSNGIAVGAQCRRDPAAPELPVAQEDLPGCERVPVIYRYHEHPTKGLIWEESYRASDADDPGGFIGAVTWLGPERALAVGGTGRYMRREVERVAGESDADYAKRDETEGAGMARAWLYANGAWRELSADEIPDQMRALNAIDASTRPADCGAGVTTECAIAGGMAQLWHFADGEFTQGYGPELAGGAGIANASAFRFRARDVRFAPGPLEQGQIRAMALTSGCCSQTPDGDAPASLSFSGAWSAGTAPSGGSFNPDSYYALNVYRVHPNSWPNHAGPAPPPNSPVTGSAIRTPGGPPEHYVREPPSRFTDRGFGRDDEKSAAQHTATGDPVVAVGIPSAAYITPVNHVPAPGSTLSSLRLVSADGDSRAFGATQTGAPSAPDGIADWAVGVLRSSGRAVAYTTAFGANRLSGSNLAGQIYLGKPSQCSGNEEELVPGASTAPATPEFGEQGVCNPEAYQQKSASKALYSLPSYALNAYRVAGEDLLEGDEGTGWAVGDHGAILTRGGGVATAELPPARAGTRSKAEPVPGGAFQEHRAEVTDEPGILPGLVPGTVATGEPGFQDAQTPSRSVSASEIVMSRDGSEGFAFGGAVYHFDGARWSYCDPTGVAGLLPPDRACAGLAEIGIQAAARVPLEHDSDPTNDDELEVVVLTEADQSGKQRLYRYREGSWSLDDSPAYDSEGQKIPLSGNDIAFTAPDDGWVVDQTTGSGFDPMKILHFDGERWVHCTPRSTPLVPRSVPADCGDPDRRLAIRSPHAVQGGGFARLATAGERVYLFAWREARSAPNTHGPDPTATDPYPMIIYRDPGGTWQGGDDNTDADASDPPDTHYDGTYDPADGGWDPGCVRRVRHPRPDVPDLICEPTGMQSERGKIRSLAVAQDADGSYQGWAFGSFGGYDFEAAGAVAMRLDESREECRASGTACWRPWQVDDATSDYLRAIPDESSARKLLASDLGPNQQLTLPSETGRRNAFLLASFEVAQGKSRRAPLVPALFFDQEAGAEGRWEAMPTPWSASKTGTFDYPAGEVRAISADGQGGFWAGVRQRVQGGPAFSLHHYTDRAPQPVFSETAHPAADSTITAMAASRDGTLWLGDRRGSVYRYDRSAGWSPPIRIPNWDPKVVTNPAAVNAIGLGPNGQGIAVGDGGRIAHLGSEVRLDASSTAHCDPQAPAPPCGTGNDLYAAAVAADGSALVGGENRALRWRPPGGEFRPIAEPEVPLATPIVKVLMPTPSRAYLLTGSTATGSSVAASRVIRGEMSSPGVWSWQFELGDAEGKPDPLTRSIDDQGLRIRDLAVDAHGHGYAVGDAALLLERTGDGDEPWRRGPSGYASYSNQGRTPGFEHVALPSGGGEGALVGGDDGLVSTVVNGRLEPARHADPYDPVTAGTDGQGGTLGLAITPGYQPGEIESWALIESGRSGHPQSLLHYTSNPADPRLDPERTLSVLADAPAPVPGELSFAALGKQDCFGSREAHGQSTFSVRDACGAHDGSNLTHELVSRRIAEELATRPADEAAPSFALFTGDAVDAPGGRESVNWNTAGGILGSNAVKTPLDGDLKHSRWLEIVAEPLEDQGLPVFGAIGGQDLARSAESCNANYTEVFFGGCLSAGQLGSEQFSLQAGANLPWRAAMARGAAPWATEREAGGLRFEPTGAGLSVEAPEATVPGVATPRVGDADPALGAAMSTGATGAPARSEPYPLGSGDTHYATDVIDEETDEKVARIVVVDTSMRSLAASDPQQHPIEPSGQLRWLEEVLCFEGSPDDLEGAGRDCTREEGQRAIVVSNTPTYSYGPISPTETQTDAATFESVLLRHRVNVVVSGRLGWQGRYWTLAPGLHSPCPDEPYRSDTNPPALTDGEICGAGPGASEESPDPNELQEELPEETREAAGLTETGAIPTVVSSTAGGNFNTRAERGGFSTRDDAAAFGFWRGYSLVRLHPSGDPAKTIVEQRPILDWVGLVAPDPVVFPRKRLALDGFAREAFGNDRPARYYDIPDSEAVTHRYHLLAADSDEPWRPIPNSDEPCGPYACLDERFGTVDPLSGVVRAGNGNYPRTFALATLSVGEHVAVAPLVFERSPSFVVNSALRTQGIPPLAKGSAAKLPPPPEIPNAPRIPQIDVPAIPPPPGIPPLSATSPPEPQPPAPPAPPPPSQQPAALDLSVAPPGVSISTPTALIQPPTPPVNPAPPGGARREARQRQAAAQKGGAGTDESTSEAREHGGDHASAPDSPDQPMTRLENPATRFDRTRPAPSFTPLARANPSGGAQGLLYGGGITLAAAILAIGFTTLRPGTRRRQPEAPAPAWSPTRRR